MTVAVATSTDGKFTTYSSENATLATALSEVLNELENYGKSLNQTRFVLTYDSNNNKYAYVAIVKNS